MRTRLFLAAMAGAGAAACSLNLDFLDDGATGAGSDASIIDAAGTNTGDQTSSDGPPDFDDAADAAAPDVASPEDAPPPVAALLPDAATVTCPTAIDGSLSASDGTQTGRLNRSGPSSVCGTSSQFPMNSADPTNPHLYNAYRFANATAASSCYSFVLTYGPPDAGDAGPQNYMAAYSTFYPADLTSGYVGDVGSQLFSPQTMGITVPAGGTIDVVVYAVDTAPAGIGPYTLSCTAQ